MTWAVVNGVRVWNHKTFVEPSDVELAAYGWSNPKAARAAATAERAGRLHSCVDCPQLIRLNRTRCKDCSNAQRALDANRPKGRYDVDEVIVQRILEGDWRLKATKGEKLAVVAAWLEAGGTQSQLGRLTGWRIERYVVRGNVEDVAA